jgi:D-tyrosyl-tRNA(Tyr) deacylase
MKALLQRVSEACVLVDGQVVGDIGPGLVMLVCAERGDTHALADKLLAKVLRLRVFADQDGKMNRSLQDLDGQGTRGGLLIVSQFTLAADVSGGNRPSFTGAAEPGLGRALYEHLLAQARQVHAPVACGRFAADMKLRLVNDGPVTIPIHFPPPAPS